MANENAFTLPLRTFEFFPDFEFPSDLTGTEACIILARAFQLK